MPSLLGDYLPYTPGRTYTPSGQLMDVPKGMAAGLLGFPGDIAQLGLTAHMKARGAQSVPQLSLTSEHIGGLLGANQSDLFNAGLIGAPGPEDVARLAPKGLLAMTLFHGTPHKFDVFDLKKIGTGEGAQAYGHGLYFAENPGVAGTYASRLTTNDRVGINSLDIIPKPGVKISDRAAAGIDEWFDLKSGDPLTQDRYDEALTQMRKELKEFPDTAYMKQAEIDELSKLTVDDFMPADGHLYEVDIPDETIAKMLDWDAPLSEQPEPLKEALFEWNPMLKMSDARHQQSQFHAWLRTPQGSAKAQELGIPGIRYYDGASRGKGEGTRNIVVFNPDDIKSVKRDGELVYQTKQPRYRGDPAQSRYSGAAYRYEPGFEGGAPRGAKVRDVINEEMERKGVATLDEFGLDNDLYDKIKELPADAVVWVGRSRQGLLDAYGPTEHWAGLLNSIDDLSDVSADVAGGRVLYEDPDGALVLRPSFERDGELVYKAGR